MKDETPQWVNDALEFSFTKTRQNLSTLTSFPERTDSNGQWIQTEPNLNGWWVGGHWVGLLWLAFAGTKEKHFNIAARDWANRLLPRRPELDDHDLGFLFELGFVLGYQFTADETLKAPALQAASTLSQRFNPRGQFIQAWGLLEASSELRGRTIMDTMMNLDLLFWAGKQTGDPKYSEIAAAHARTTLTCHMRPDGSTSHVCDFNPDTGAFIKQDTHQGMSANSCWSRGQAWGVYGFADCFRATGDVVFLNTSRRLFEYFWERMPEALVPFWDFDSPQIPNDVRDSSAASVLASGLLNLASVEIDSSLAELWRERAVSILESLWKNYTSKNTGEASILIHGTRSKPHNLMDHGLIYGDYYFVEALMRLAKPDLTIS